MDDIRTHLSGKITYFREREGLSQRELADALKVDKSTIWRAENGAWPDFKTLEAIAAKLGVKVEEFFLVERGPDPKIKLFELVATFDDDQAERALAALDILALGDSAQTPAPTLKF